MEERAGSRDFGTVVDAPAAPDFVRYLEVLYSEPAYLAWRAATFDAMDAMTGLRVLDVGTGPGYDAVALAARVGETGSVLGVDTSETMINTARSLAPAGVPLRFEVADATGLPFPSGSFDRVRCARVLLHLAAPERAVAEIIRVCASDGRVVLSEPDWGGLLVDGDDVDLFGRLRASWARTLTGGLVGRRVGRLLRDAGAGQVTVHAYPVVVDDFVTARTMFRLDEFLAASLEVGAATEDEIDQWLAAQEQLDRTGSFLLCMPFFTAVGRT